jgi:hypothetical protein
MVFNNRPIEVVGFVAEDGSSLTKRQVVVTVEETAMTDTRDRILKVVKSPSESLAGEYTIPATLPKI